MIMMTTFIPCFFITRGHPYVTFCGAFTTFSAFAYESMAYWHEGKFDIVSVTV
jgi:fluoride ion exporter CrcB/FEX